MVDIDIRHHGAVHGVTGSCHELRFRTGPGILVDCGLFQGAETSGQGANFDRMRIEFPIEHIQALVITHVHIDHVGRVPYLLAAGFDKPIYCSEASAILLPLVLEDAVKIGFTRNQRLIDQFLARIKALIVTVPYKEWITICSETSAPGKGEKQGKKTATSGEIAIRLQPAGHILGSAWVECDCRSLNRKGILSRQRVVFSGDLGAPYAPLLPAPRSPWRADTLIIESTYGDRLHEGRRTRQQQLKKIIERALSNRGALLIPAFSIGRTQEILYELEGLIHKYADQELAGNKWRDIEIIVDSPLANRFTRVYASLKACWDREALRRVRAGRHPLNFEQLYTVNSHEEHLSTLDYIRRQSRPCIVIAASGMCAGGRIVNYLKALIGDPCTDVLFIGYQAAGTPGRTIQQYGPGGGYVELDGQRYDIRASIHMISGYSAHADQKDLLNFVKRMRHKPAQVRIVHGDEHARQGLQVKLKELLPEAEVMVATE